MPASSNPVITWNHRPLTLTAQVNALINPTDTLLWEHEFVRGMNEIGWGNSYDLAWNGESSTSESGTQIIYEGLYRFEAGNDVDADHPIEFINSATQEALGILDSADATFFVTVPLGASIAFDAQQTAGQCNATVRFTQTGQWDTSGTQPTIIGSGNQLTVQCIYTPGSGLLTARAKAYDGNGFLIATSAEIALNIIAGNDGGC